MVAWIPLLLRSLHLRLRLLEAKHLLLLKLLGLLWLLVSLVVHHLDVAEAQIAHLELRILLSIEVVLVWGLLLRHLSQVGMGLVVVLLDVELHRLGMLQIHLALWRLLHQILDLVALLTHPKLLLLKLLLHEVLLLVMLRLLLSF